MTDVCRISEGLWCLRCKESVAVSIRAGNLYRNSLFALCMRAQIWPKYVVIKSCSIFLCNIMRSTSRGFQKQIHFPEHYGPKSQLSTALEDDPVMKPMVLAMLICEVRAFDFIKCFFFGLTNSPKLKHIQFTKITQRKAVYAHIREAETIFAHQNQNRPFQWLSSHPKL